MRKFFCWIFVDLLIHNTLQYIHLAFIYWKIYVIIWKQHMNQKKVFLASLEALFLKNSAFGTNVISTSWVLNIFYYFKKIEKKFYFCIAFWMLINTIKISRLFIYWSEVVSYLVCWYFCWWIKKWAVFWFRFVLVVVF